MRMSENSSIQNEGKIKNWIIVISVIIPLVVAVLIFMPAKLDLGAEWVYFLSHLNAVINSAATLALIAGFVVIKKGNIPYHCASMIVAFGLGAIFLISYVIYHAAAESTSFGGEGLIRSIYFFF